MTGAALATTRQARAVGAIVGSTPEAAEVTGVRVAVASAGTRTSRWVSLRVHGDGTAFAWIVPVKPGTFVDLASDAWLESLEDATAPRVLPPPDPPAASCGAADGVDVTGDASHVATTPPDFVAAAANTSNVAATLAAWGLSVPGDLAPLLDAAGAAGDSFLVMRFAAGSGDVQTRTLRLVDTAAPAVDLTFTRASSPFSVTAYAVNTGAAVFGDTPLLAVDPSLLLWSSGGASTYADASQSLLSGSPGAWLVDTAAHAPLFEGEPLPGGQGVPSLAQAYFARASAYGDTNTSAAECTSAASSWASSLSPVAVACPAAAVGRIGSSGSAPCEEVVGPGELSPDPFRCGGTADDLAIALSGLSPAGTWVARARSIVGASTFGSDAAVATASEGVTAEPNGPVYACSGYASGCLGGGATGAGGSSGGSSGAPSSTGSSTGDGTDPGASAAGAVAGAALDSSDGCGGDSSGSSSDGCGGSPDSGGDSSTSNDGSCSGDSSSSSSSDSCSSDSSSSSSSNCAIWGARPAGSRGRSPTSRIVMLLAILAFVMRRRGRTLLA